mmetsp:Transcript_66550/g.138962  ORF Transcript_66550/g.138962 Transcript_66550/m.138962 type:complete len:220 (-) Transcript_66550:414-1073(-)|eukprot:CAMPEP_0206457328 /NCGR_PEP_ID=MMETSP0324_2-20121206/22895_1 /ASSEMBLY_ACC=CAM_ASM_000836 /TAXON_ID=2866 /ORGANISM="Crypthecodinium cohnii, Strain Seligo" /LENGTH=219 /DNA_ID=CAMNT_0053928427 /DNA_START=99 /DNA_END=758 /DNA_ORIENTATION=+
MDFVKGIMENAAGVVEQLQELGGEALMQAVMPVMRKAVTEILDHLGDQVAHVTAEKMIEKFPILEKFDDLMDKAKEMADEYVEGQKEWVLDFVEDVVDGFDGNLPKVGSTILKTARGACDKAVDNIFERTPLGGCCSCLASGAMKETIDGVKKDSYESVRDKSKNELKEKIANAGAPPAVQKFISEKMDALLEKFDPDMDVGEPKHKRAPKPETMPDQA